MTTARKRALAVAITLIVAAIVGAGIALVTRGGNATASSNTTAQAGDGSGQAPQAGGGPNSATFQRFRQCMQANGAPALQPGTRPNPNDPAFAQARQACSQYAPQRAPGGGFGGRPPGANQNATPSSATTAADKLQATSERKVA